MDSVDNLRSFVDKLWILWVITARFFTFCACFFLSYFFIHLFFLKNRPSAPVCFCLRLKGGSKKTFPTAAVLLPPRNRLLRRGSRVHKNGYLGLYLAGQNNRFACFVSLKKCCLTVSTNTICCSSNCVL